MSYNCWHTEPQYRVKLSSIVEAELPDATRGVVAPYGPRSGFQPPNTSAEELLTHERWKGNLHDYDRQTIWTACRDPEIAAAELAFHGPTAPVTRIEDLWTIE